MSFWTDDPRRQVALERGARRGDSASTIARALGCTRNAVIGRAWRTDVALQGAAHGDPSVAGRAAAAARRLNPIHLKRSAVA